MMVACASVFRLHTLAAYLITPAMGAHFTMYLASMAGNPEVLQMMFAFYLSISGRCMNDCVEESVCCVILWLHPSETIGWSLNSSIL